MPFQHGESNLSFLCTEEADWREVLQRRICRICWTFELHILYGTGSSWSWFTLLTAGGSSVPRASIFGYGKGTAKGGSPKARVAAYKVCWPDCSDADILAGFDAAISDGVNVLSVSLSNDPTEFFMNGIVIGSFYAARNGIVVVSFPGNSGPQTGTVLNLAPWMVTVAASTIDWEFTKYVALGNKQHLKGSSLSANGLPSNKFYPLIRGADAQAENVSAAEPLLCKARTRPQEASGNDVVADAHILPAARIIFMDGKVLFAYIKSRKNPRACITCGKTMLSSTPAPFMASFSSRGPNTVEPAILKPNITVPGLSIIAAYTLAVGPAAQGFDKRQTPFNVESGTSMPCPHVAGIVGLLKTLYPCWSPTAIQSAIMTTAKTRDNKVQPVLNASFAEATPFSYDAGHIRPNQAMKPGLAYDLTGNRLLGLPMRPRLQRIPTETYSPMRLADARNILSQRI